ncbi:MAG: hypothetical protein C4K49_06230 [Candidatus Thorarchaeota archaeon]|nr:MAG: hypothetical protein C4K49_06230 [Candidatus Thorarchaeota archaeon]
MSGEKLGYNYDGPIFDAHSHAADETALKLMMEVAAQYGVEKRLLILHSAKPAAFEEKYSGRLVFARFLMISNLRSLEPDKLKAEIDSMAVDGYSVAKMHFAPLWIDRLAEQPLLTSVNDERLDTLFGVLEERQIPVLIHVADPDTYYATRYADMGRYGTKDKHIGEFEERLSRNSRLHFQVAHFGAQPEPERLANLGRMFDRYSNLSVDTGSARWMVRELGRSPIRAREFIIKYSGRVLFGTDCVARTLERGYYEGRYSSERLLWETNVSGVPLPFADTDTENSGGTFINGLSLPKKVLGKLYWENAQALYGF